MRTSELTGAMLDYWVAKAEGLEAEVRSYQMDPLGKGVETIHYCNLKKGNRPFSPSTSWVQGGPLIDKHRPHLHASLEGWYSALLPLIGPTRGDTALQAICRACVVSKFGEEVQEGSESNG